MILAILAVVTVSFQPPVPKVGDLITIDFAAPVTLDPSTEYEVVSRSGGRVVVRTFTPKPFALSGVTGNVRFRNLQVPVQSVLQPNDPLAPAPLVPPRDVPYPRAPFVAIALAALCALAVWLLLWRRSRARLEVMQPAEALLAPEERFRRAVLALRQNAAHPKRWARLADETRAYLAATRPQLPSDLTTTELVPRLSERDRVVIDILRQGDREKFSPRGAEPADFEEVAHRALEIAS